MNITSLARVQVEEIVEGNITFLESFEKNGILDEKVEHFWFEYRDNDETFPFTFKATFTRNWLDEKDKTPIVELGFSTIMAKNGQFRSFGNDVLKDEKRRKEIQQFYFKFEAFLLEEMNKQPISFGFKRDQHRELFENYSFFLKNKGITHSGRNEMVPNLEFEENTLWDSEEEYKQSSFIAERRHAKCYIRYFLQKNECDPIVKAFLTYVLHSNKTVRITRDTSFWNYTFCIRPDMLTEDTNTLSKLGQHICYDFDNDQDRLSAMKYIFDLFSTHGMVNICLDKTTLKQLHNRESFIDENPMLALFELHEMIENKKTDNTPENYQEFEEKYNKFLNGLLDLYNNYQKNEKYQKRAQRVKSLWLKYIK